MRSRLLLPSWKLAIVLPLSACALPSYEVTQTTSTGGAGATGGSPTTSQGGGGSTSTQGGGGSGPGGTGPGGSTTSQGGGGSTTTSSGTGGSAGCVECGALAWAKTYVAGGDQTVLDVAVDGDGNVLVAGSFSGNITLGGVNLTANGLDAFVVKLAPTGTHLWSKQLGLEGNQKATSIAALADGSVVVAGAFDGTIDFGGDPLQSTGGTRDCFVAKLGPDGSFGWSYAFGGAQTQGVSALAVDSLDNVYIAGDFTGDINFAPAGTFTNGGLSDLFLAKLDPAGAVLWAKAVTGAGQQLDARVAVDGNDSVYWGGTANGETDTPSGMFDSGTGRDVFVLKLTSAGVAGWQRVFGGSTDVFMGSLAASATGKVALTGSFMGTFTFDTPLTADDALDIYVGVLDGGDGVPVWARSFGVTGNQRGLAVAFDPEGRVLFGGEMIGSMSLGGPMFFAADQDAFVASFSPSGEHVWSRPVGGIGDQTVASLATDAMSSVVCGGYFFQQIDFGDQSTNATDGEESFVAKLSP